MPYKIEWLIAERVILTKFIGTVNADDIENLTQDLIDYIASGTPMVHHISDASDMEKIDISLKAIQAIVKAFKPNPKFGWHLSVTSRVMDKMISSLSSQFANIRFRTVDTIEDAVKFLREHEDTISEAEWDAITLP